MNDRIPFGGAAAHSPRLGPDPHVPAVTASAIPHRLPQRTFRHVVSLLRLPEPRQSARWACEAPITFHEVAMRTPCRGRGAAVNVSRHGLALRSPRGFSVGQFLAVTFPGVQPFPPPLVLRVVHTSFLPDGHTLLGAAWVRPLSPQQLATLLAEPTARA